MTGTKQYASTAIATSLTEGQSASRTQKEDHQVNYSDFPPPPQERTTRISVGSLLVLAPVNGIRCAPGDEGIEAVPGNLSAAHKSWSTTYDSGGNNCLSQQARASTDIGTVISNVTREPLSFDGFCCSRFGRSLCPIDLGDFPSQRFEQNSSEFLVPRRKTRLNPCCKRAWHGYRLLDEDDSSSNIIQTTPALPTSGEVMTSSPAQRTVLSTPELLVLILSQLPHSALLRVKLVNTVWASLFKFAEIQAALFLRPRPEGSALYAEPYSDLLVNRVFSSNEWPSKRYRCRSLSKYMRPPWGDLLVCQPAVEYLEIIIMVHRIPINSPKFIHEARILVHQPGGLRLRYFLNVVKYWHSVSRNSVKLLWDRKTGDPADQSIIYPAGHSGNATDGKPCITIFAMTTERDTPGSGYRLRSWFRPERLPWGSAEEKFVFTVSPPRTIEIVPHRVNCRELENFIDQSRLKKMKEALGSRAWPPIYPSTAQSQSHLPLLPLPGKSKQGQQFHTRLASDSSAIRSFRSFG